jgi:hypothetical protein
VANFVSITQALYDLATYLEYLPILREEVLSVPMTEDGLFGKESISAIKGWKALSKRVKDFRF